ncbi:MAG: hypothetical protein ACR2HG_08090 [Pyrinomonadaceae bacterium]
MATRDKKTSDKAAKDSSNVLRDGRTAAKSKTAAGSSLSQAGGGKKTTGAKAADKASKVLKDKESGAKSKTAAGSALAQKTSKKK